MKFEKCNIATLCKPLAECESFLIPVPHVSVWCVSLVARSGDDLAQHVFSEAGAALGAHVKALAPQAEDTLRKATGGLHVVAVGSVLTCCWDLLKDGMH